MRKVLYILGELADSDLQWIADAGAPRTVSSGEAIIQEGSPLGSLFIVLDGELSVTTVAAGAKPVASLGAGEIVGEMSFLDSRPPSATVTAAKDSQVFDVSQSKVRRKLESDPRFASRFYRAICIFLANRLNRTMTMMGSGEKLSLKEDVSEGDEISPEALENVALAGARFEWFLERIRR